MEFKQLQQFLAVVTEMNFSRAAARLEIAQPALSRHIQALERELDVQLFDRSKRQIVLTAAGSAFLIDARRLLEESEQVKHAARRAARGETGRIAVGFVGSAMYGPLLRSLSAYRERFPSVRIALYEMETSLQAESLLQRRIDIGLVRAPLNDPNLATEILLREPMIVAIPENHRFANREAIQLQELAEEPFILFPRGRAPSYADQIVAACAKAGFQPRVSQEAVELQTGISLVIAGFGICIVPNAVGHLRRPGLLFKPLIDPTPETTLIATYRADNHSPALQEFLRTLRSQAE